MLRLQTSLAAFVGETHGEAAHLAMTGVSDGTLIEPGLVDAGHGCNGRLQLDQVQLVPQSFGRLTQQLCESLSHLMPDTKFRLHANVRVLQGHRIADLSNLPQQLDWFEQAARISRFLDAPAYTAHSGRRANATMAQMFDNARRCADLFDCPVGIEGQYPTRAARECGAGEWLVDSWAEYQQLFESGLPYALDLSHLNILARHTGLRNESLIADMLASDHCIEVHVSDNDGHGDWHQPCETPPWWLPLLPHVHPAAVVFSEGNRCSARLQRLRPAAPAGDSTSRIP